MTHLDSHPIPQTARHDADGNHIPPHIPDWRRNPGAHAVKGSQVEADQRRKAAFAAHLAEHARLNQPTTVIEES